MSCSALVVVNLVADMEHSDLGLFLPTCITLQLVTLNSIPQVTSLFRHSWRFSTSLSVRNVLVALVLSAN